jgi:hypothetical protein
MAPVRTFGISSTRPDPITGCSPRPQLTTLVPGGVASAGVQACWRDGSPTNVVNFGMRDATRAGSGQPVVGVGASVGLAAGVGLAASVGLAAGVLVAAVSSALPFSHVCHGTFQSV